MKRLLALFLLQEGTTRIETRFNEQPVTIRVHMQKGIVRSCNGFPGYSKRKCPNTINIGY